MSDKYGLCSFDELSEGVQEFSKLIGREFIDRPTKTEKGSQYKQPAMVTMTLEEYDSVRETVVRLNHRLSKITSEMRNIEKIFKDKDIPLELFRNLGNDVPVTVDTFDDVISQKRKYIISFEVSKSIYDRIQKI